MSDDPKKFWAGALKRMGLTGPRATVRTKPMRQPRLYIAPAHAAMFPQMLERDDVEVTRELPLPKRRTVKRAAVKRTTKPKPAGIGVCSGGCGTTAVFLKGRRLLCRDCLRGDE